jgi:hypothetical protein
VRFSVALFGDVLLQTTVPMSKNRVAIALAHETGAAIRTVHSWLSGHEVSSFTAWGLGKAAMLLGLLDEVEAIRARLGVRVQ